MKKVILLLCIAIISIQSAYAYSDSRPYAFPYDITKNFDLGAIYTGSSFPIEVSKNLDKEKLSLENLKYGESTTNNILGLIETGDRGIRTAARNGGITKIHYVDCKVSKVYIPLFFIPIYVKQTKTIVYGE